MSKPQLRRLRKRISRAAKRRSKRNRTSASRRPLTFEQLEDRRVLALVVDSTLDIVDGSDSLFTLREALIAANATPGTDMIDLTMGGTFTLTLGGTGEDGAETGDLDILDNVTFMGAGSGSTIVDAGGIDRVFHIPFEDLLDPTPVTSVTFAGLTIKGGVATDIGSSNIFNPFFASSGGGILNEVAASSLTLADVVLTENAALGSTLAPLSDGQGGGIATEGGTWTITNSEITDNDAIGAAGGEGKGGGIFANASTAKLLIDTTIARNEARGGLGGAAGKGGGIYSNFTSWMKVGSATVDDNLAKGGLGSTTGGDGLGGGIFSEFFSSWTLTLAPGTTISNNEAIGGDGDIGGSGRGGGIYAIGDVWTGENATVSNNKAIGGVGALAAGGNAIGGGLYVTTGATFTSEYLTIAENDATGGAGTTATGTGAAGGVFSDDDLSTSAFTLLHGTIIASNTASSINPDVGDALGSGGGFVSFGYNLIGNVGTTGLLPGPGDLIGTVSIPKDPRLGPLQNNGGPTETHALLTSGPASPAIDAVDSFSFPATDQRGVPRPMGSHPDIGAFESPQIIRIDVEKFVSVDGGVTFEDADSGPGPTLFSSAGVDPVFRYVLTNPGNVALDNISLIDSKLGTLIPPTPGMAGGDANNDGKLDINETWTVEVTGTFAPGQNTNTATATGEYVFTGGISTVGASDMDDANYFGALVAIDIQKKTNGVDVVSNSDLNMPQIAPGAPVNYTYKVRNVGNVGPLDNVLVKDDNGTPTDTGDDFFPTFTGGDTNTNNMLDIGEVWTYAFSTTAEDLRVVIDFETDGLGSPLAPGTIIDTEYANLGLTVMADEVPATATNRAMLFDSSAPTAGDTDLGAANIAFVGAGIGAGGGIGAAGENRYAQGNVLIVSDDLVQGTPDAANSGVITFDWAVPVRVNQIHMLDVEFAGSTIDLFDASLSLITTIAIPPVGNNGFQVISINEPFVKKMVVNFPTEKAAITLVDYDRSLVNEVTATGDFNPTAVATDTSAYRNPLEAAIDVEKATNAVDPLNPTPAEDADNPTGPVLLAGTQADFTYIVTATGDVPLVGANTLPDVTPIVVIDDNGTPGDLGDDLTLTLDSGDLNGNDVLDLNEKWLYKASRTVTAGQFTNIGSVMAVDSTGQVTGSATDSDPSNHFGADPQIEIEKRTLDGTTTAGSVVADFATAGDGITVMTGDPVTWIYQVTLDAAGNVPLSNISVTDSEAGATPAVLLKTGGDTDNVLESGEIWYYTAVGTAVLGNYSNIGMASGSFTDDAGASRTDTETDPSSYFGEQPVGGEGCTPGFWKTHSHYGPAPEAGWDDTAYDPDDLVDTVFGTKQFGNTTLLEAMQTGGGGVNALMRHAVAALLNASNPNISYDLTVNQVIQMTNDALAPGGDVEGTKDVFADFNEQGCDLSPGGGSGDPGVPNGANVQGIVWVDKNGNGAVDQGEPAIQNVTISLTGSDLQGNSVSLSEVTDGDGVFQFDDLPASDSSGYTITEVQPAGFDNDREYAGSINGVPVSDDANVFFDDKFTVVLALGDLAENFNFAEQVGDQTGVYLEAGTTATIGFWQNKNGQNLIRSLNGGAYDTQLGTWLANSFPGLYGATSTDPVNSLAGQTNADVAAYFKQIFKTKKKNSARGPAKLDPQAMAVALSVYVTDRGLAGGTAAESYGFATYDPIIGNPGMAGTGGRFIDVDAAVGAGSAELLFGVGTPPVMTVMDILTLTNENSSGGVLFEDPDDGDDQIDMFEQILRSLANDLFSAINETGDI